MGELDDDARDIGETLADMAAIARGRWTKLDVLGRAIVVKHLLDVMAVLHPVARRRGAKVIPLRRGRS